jgi:hypothetical protein
VTEAEPPRFFFIHVMKTGGTSFVFQMLANFERDEAYPSPVDRDSPTDVTPYASIPKLLALSPERRARIRVYAGHLPYVASELLGFDPIRLTLLREPVDRTVSMLKHVKRLFEHYHERSLEEIYDDDAVFRHYLDNAQTKVFALTVEERDLALAAAASASADDAPPLARSVPIPPHRFEQAKANLTKVDVVGLNESYGDFLDELHTRFGWWPNGVKQQARANVSTEEWAVSPELRARIAADLTVDMEFYEFAKQLVAARRRPREAG